MLTFIQARMEVQHVRLTVQINLKSTVSIHFLNSHNVFLVCIYIRFSKEKTKESLLVAPNLTTSIL